MGKKGILGVFEQFVMLAVMQLDGGAYAVPVRRLIEDRTGQRVSRGAVYTTLDRLEAKGLLTSHFGPPTPEPGGKAKRLYSVSPEGISALREARVASESLWSGVEELLEEIG